MERELVLTTLTEQEIYATQKRATLDALIEFEQKKKNEIDPYEWVPAFCDRNFLKDKLNTCKNTIISWEKSGLLEPIKQGRTVRYSRESVIHALEAMKSGKYFKKVKS